MIAGKLPRTRSSTDSLSDPIREFDLLSSTAETQGLCADYRIRKDMEHSPLLPTNSECRGEGTFVCVGPAYYGHHQQCNGMYAIWTACSLRAWSALG
jgi:hypothetical protein